MIVMSEVRDYRMKATTAVFFGRIYGLIWTIFTLNSQK